MINLPRNLELTKEDGTMSRDWFDSLVKVLRGKAEVTETNSANVPADAQKIRLYYDGKFLYTTGISSAGSFPLSWDGTELTITLP